MTGVFVRDVAVTSNQRTGASSQGDFPLLRVWLVTLRFMAGWRTVSCQKVAFKGAGAARCHKLGCVGFFFFFSNLEENSGEFTESQLKTMESCVFLHARPGQLPPRAPL